MIQKIRWFLIALMILGSCSSDKAEIIYIGFAVPDGPHYAPVEIQMINYTQNATTYQWDFGDQSTSTEFEPVHLYNDPGDYLITLTASNSGYTKTVSKNLQILAGQPVITAPPSNLNLNPFYKKYIDADGIPVISSDKVPDDALFRVRIMAQAMLKKSPAVRTKMISYRARIGIMGKNEVTTDIPEHAFLANDPNTDWDKRARGLGGTVAVPISTCAEENVLCYTDDPYRHEDIFVHEFAHAIHLMGIRYVDPDFDKNLKNAFDQAKAAGKWVRTYAGTNTEEYWAEGVQSWFNCAAQADPPNGVYNHVNTRVELMAYDRGLYDLLLAWLPEDPTSISCHKN
jgi:PKD repeat protein